MERKAQVIQHLRWLPVLRLLPLHLGDCSALPGQVLPSDLLHSARLCKYLSASTQACLSPTVHSILTIVRSVGENLGPWLEIPPASIHDGERPLHRPREVRSRGRSLCTYSPRTVSQSQSIKRVLKPPRRTVSTFVSLCQLSSLIAKICLCTYACI